jgi:hypothetical protein
MYGRLVIRRDKKRMMKEIRREKQRKNEKKTRMDHGIHYCYQVE